MCSLLRSRLLCSNFQKTFNNYRNQSTKTDFVPFTFTDLKLLDFPMKKKYMGRRARDRRKGLRQYKVVDYIHNDDIHFDRPVFSKDDSLPGYENIPELTSAPESVKRIYSMEFATDDQIQKKAFNQFLEEISSYKGETASLELEIARLTVLIRHKYHSTANISNRRWKAIRVHIRLRKECLRLLQDLDKERFEWLCDQLDLQYISRAKIVLPFFPIRERVNAAQATGKEARLHKMKALKEEFEKERIENEGKRAKEVVEIVEELKSLGMKSTNSLEEILGELGMLDLIDDGVPKLTSKQRYWQKQAALYGAGPIPDPL